MLVEGLQGMTDGKQCQRLMLYHMPCANLNADKEAKAPSDSAEQSSM